MLDIESTFTGIGGQFYESPNGLEERLNGITGYIFDWDGVFNDGHKNADGYSSFSEVDAMGINMLRFSHFLATGKQPSIFVVTGEKNPGTEKLSLREHFHGVFYGIKRKAEVLQILDDRFKVKAESCAFIFDDILDISLSMNVGLRFFIPRKSNPVLNDYIIRNNICEYATAHTGGYNAIRECCELVIALRKNGDETINSRANFEDNYVQYLRDRDAIQTVFYQAVNGNIKEM